MTNYEKYKEIIDLILEQGKDIAFNKNTKEVLLCHDLDCEDCLFHRNTGSSYCNVNSMKWLIAECKEVDWSKVPIDTPVLVSNNKDFWYRRYFAGVNDEGKPLVFPDGRTSWSNARCSRIWISYKYIELAEVE